MADLNISGDIQISPTSLTGSLHPTTINLSGDLDTGNGKDGYSPTVTVTEITDGHRVVITDKNGSHTFDVMDGSDATVTVDDALSGTSTNPVQNKKVKEALDSLDAGDIAYDDEETYSEGTVGDGLSSLKADINHLSNNKADIIISNASGAIASFSDGADGLPMISVVAHIDPVQSGTGDPSPINVRPISGWTQAKVTRTGKNLLNDNKWINGNNVYLGQEHSGYPILLKPGTYTISVTSAVAVALYMRGTVVEQTRLTPGSQTNSVATFIVEQEDNYQIWAYASDLTIDGITEYQLELGSTATDYEPYQGNTYTVSWQTEAGEVFGGYVDVTNGKLVVDREKKQFGDLSWGDSSGLFRANIPNALCTTGFVTQSYGLCNVYKNTSKNGLSNTDDAFAIRQEGTLPASRWIYVKDSTYVDAIAFSEAMADAYVVYELNTPIEYDLTPQEITSLLGVNNVWSDTGDTDVTYRADTKLYLESHMPEIPVEDVQVNGASVVNQGVANVPVASSTTLGVGKVSAAYGTNIIASDGIYKIEQASSSNIKSGTQGYKPIVPERQHESAFYGLAKAAGDSSQSASSNAVGVYTDSAKVAIQKMLGIYEAPWELIREDTVTNETEADIEIAVDGNGQPFELTDIMLMFCTPVQETAAAKSGQVQISLNNISYRQIRLEPGSWTQAANTPSHGFYTVVKQHNGLVETYHTYQTVTGNPQTLRFEYFGTFDKAANQRTNGTFLVKEVYGNDVEKAYITSINLKSVTGTGYYKLYGKRKWS